jgi:hypothetical protein
MCTRSLITLWHDDWGSKPVMGSTRSLLYMSIEFEGMVTATQSPF